MSKTISRMPQHIQDFYKDHLVIFKKFGWSEQDASYEAERLARSINEQISNGCHYGYETNSQNSSKVVLGGMFKT